MCISGIMLNNLRDALRPVLERLGRGFSSTGLSPNFWTCVGLVLALTAAVAYGLGFEHALLVGGILILISGFFDIVDGQVARVTGKASSRGAYLDSVSDKIAESAIFVGIVVGGYAEPWLVVLAATLSLLVGYARAKSDSLNIQMQGIGIGERAERLLVIAIVGIIGYMEAALVIVSIIAGITLVQRMIVTMRQL